MMSNSAAEFRLEGAFTGFVRTREGKKRMALQTATGEVLLKVECELRKELTGWLARGAMIAVSGEVRTVLFSGEMRQVVTRVEIIRGEGTAACLPPGCTIRICAGKNCWKQGGRELWRVLEGEIKARGWSDGVRLKAVGCLDECKYAPNLKLGGRIHRHCSPAQASALLASLESSTSA